MNGVCSGLCTCKRNVEGRRCDRCKRGFFALYESHSKGCLECFCNGITDQWNDKQCIDFKKSFGDHFHQGFVTKVDLEAKKIFIGDDQESPLEYTDVVFAVGKY